ncbi:MAG: hypothetical protein ABI869_04995 [Actinomycetota bacterium]
MTVVSLGTSGLRITETDSYVTGEEAYRTDVTVTNTNEVQVTAVLYRAGDCFLQNSDRGFGSSDPTTGSVSCVAGVLDDTGNFVPGSRIEQWFPLSPGSHYLEDGFDNVWAAIGTQLPFTDSCSQCSNYIDNGAGLSWGLTIPAGGSATRSHLTVFSPLGNVPLSTTKTADSVTTSAGGADGYTVTIHNPNTVAVSLNSITDTLPAGFSYTGGSTTGATTADPSISSQDLSWSGPISVPASGDASIHFNVTVASGPGDYFNNAGGTAEGFTVAPTGDTAKITVTDSSAQFSATIDTSQGGVLLLIPDDQNNLGTTGKIVIPPQPGPATDVVITASLFGQPGEIDATCGGNVCVGQGIEWAVSDPSAVTKMKVIFIEAPSLVGGVSASLAKVYKDGVLLPDCPSGPVNPSVTGPCVRRRDSTTAGGWRIRILATGDDPRGRI